MTKEDIWNLYFHSPREIKDSPYFTRYFFWLLAKRKEEIVNSKEKLTKFALISLFPIYRSCNHIGCDINSNEYENYFHPEDLRLKNIEIVIGRKLKSTEDYLNLTGIRTSWFIWIPFIPISLKFYWLIFKTYGSG